MPKVHPTAIVHPKAQLADDVEVGPYCVIESDVAVGAGTVLRESVVIRRFTTLGEGNFVDAFSVLGGEPQDLKFDHNCTTYLRIGDGNTFREGVTISRATGEGNSTVIGNKTYWMAGAHAGHNVTIADEVILVNGAAVGGYVTIGRRVILSNYVGIHQFCRIGELAMGQGHAAVTMHVPPYTIFFGASSLASLNLVGLQRAPYLTDEDRRQIKEAFRLLYRSKLKPAEALEKLDAIKDWGEAADKFRRFVRDALSAKKPYDRGLAPLVSHSRSRRP